MKLIKPNNFEIDSFEQTQFHSLLDECVILSQTITRDSTGRVIVGFTESGTVPCGFTVWNVGELEPSRSTGVQPTFAMAQLRLPKNTAVTHKDRIKLIKRRGKPVTPKVYDILGTPQPGNDVLLLNLQASEV